MTVKTGPKIVTDGLTLCLDAGNRFSYPGSGTTWFDISGNSLTGTLVNGPTYSTEAGGCLVFDGTNDFINTTLSTSNLGMNTSTGATLTQWIKPNMIPGQYRAGSSFTANLGNDVDFGYDFGGTALRLWKNTSTYLTTNLSQYDYVWSLFTFTSTPSNMKLYINDSLIVTWNKTGNLTNTSGRVLKLMDHWDAPIPGNLSTTMAYSRDLSLSEVIQNYNATKSRFGL